MHTLTTGAIEVSGQFVWGSNYTFLVKVGPEDDGFHAVYKPSEGERPLWDFPPQTLAQREVAAYLTSKALGWDLVPPTVLRADGPGGGGSLQLFVEADPERHYFTFSETDKTRLRPAALFDVVINNADRKGGHVILGDNNHIWLIDHGVCFHEDYKLRTVIWDFAGEEIPSELLRDLEAFRKVLDDYSAYFLDQLIMIAGSATVVSYALYTVSPHTISQFGSSNLIYTVPFVLYGLYRYLYLVHQKELGGNPTKILLTDVPTLVNVVLWLICAVALIYWTQLAALF